MSKPLKIELVKQEQKAGCSPACIAMILGWTYEQVTEWFHTDFDKNGISHKTTREFITDRGYQAITKEVWCMHTTATSNKEMLKPFAPIHLLEMKGWIDHPSWHAIVMDDKGKLYDPTGDDGELVRKRLYYIQKITGFWKVDATL